MFVSEPLREQIDRMRGDRLRVLIVGAGVAGLTLAQLLRTQGLHPVLIERAADHADAGYMLALVPLVAPAMRQLGITAAYRARSVPFHRYGLHGRHGKLLREYDIGSLMGKYGDYCGLARGDLMQALATPCAPVTHASTLQALRQTTDTVRATLESAGIPHECEFDTVVLADGMHSSSRALVLDADQVETYDSAWGGWVAWIDTDEAHADRGDEVWGTDFFVGIYPVKGRAGVFVGGDRADMQAGPAAFVAHIRSQLRTQDAWIERALDMIAGNDGLYFWKLVDVRSATWTVNRVALLGDAAAGFLPTAGIGAAMAMESAHALALRLATASPATVRQVLQDYERAQRPRVEAAQDNSRQLAKMMFRRSPWLAMLRDGAARFISLAAALRPIRRLLDTAPDLSTPMTDAD